jgi:hypothetical protein
VFKQLSDEVLEEIFCSILKGSLTVETKDIEYKESFGWGSKADYMKIMAAFSNARGGYIIYGIKEKPCTPIGLRDRGLNEFDGIDHALFSDALRNQFNREIIWDKRTYSYEGLQYGIIYTLEADNKPIISMNNKDKKLRKNAIYYRYNSQSTEIEPGDLENILESEKQRYVNILLKNMTIIANSGVRNISLFNHSTGDLFDVGASNTNIVVDSKLLKEIKFIKEGQFTETEGEPVLILKGSIQNIYSQDPVIVNKPTPKAITQHDVIQQFLEQSPVEEPIEYLKQICTYPSANFPIYYYIAKINQTIPDIIAELKSYGIPNKTKDKMIQRLSSPEKSLHKPCNQNSKISNIKQKHIKELKKKKGNVPNCQEEGGDKKMQYFLQAIQALPQKNVVILKSYLLPILQNIYQEALQKSNCQGATKTEFRKAMCWVDEALYFSEHPSQ